MISYSETTSEDLFGEEDMVLYLRTVLRYMRVPIPILLPPPPSLPLPSIMPTSQWAHQPSLRSMCRSHKRSYKRQLFGALPPPRRVLGHCARWGRCFFFNFLRGGPCPPGAYNLAGEAQLMHTYTIITISNFHNIDHNCMRPGKRSMRDWGLGGVLVKLGFFY